MTHDQLASDLAEFRRQCGELAFERLSLGSFSAAGIMDLATVRRSKTDPRPTCYEVKVARSDLLADLRAEKWRRYLPHCRRLYFAMPKGLAIPKEIPPEAGLMLLGPRGWYSAKAAPMSHRRHQDFADLYMAMLLNGAAAPWKGASRAERIANGMAAKTTGRSTAQRLGKRVAEIMNENHRLRSEVRWFRLLEDRPTMPAGEDSA